MMKQNLFTPGVAEALLLRLENLTADAQPQWGVLSAAQMLKHMQLENDLALGNYHGKDYSNFIREWAFKRVIKGKMNLPPIFSKLRLIKAIPELDVLKSKVEVGDFDTEKVLFQKGFKELLNRPKLHTLHPAIGKMNQEEWGFFYAWHTDYHLTQFGV